MIPILLVVTATFRPPAPTVGDLITINFQQRVTLDKSPQYEIVSQRGSRAVIRTFEPRPFTISGRVGDVLFRKGWTSATVDEVARTTLAAIRGRADITGPEVAIGARVTVALSLLLHELATNAAKYGGTHHEGARIGIRARGLATPQGASIEIRAAENSPIQIACTI